MLIKLNDFLKPSNLLNFPHRAIVASNIDSKNLGRIKVFIPDLITDTDIDKLPWIYPKSSTSTGGRRSASTFSVPDIGSEVLVEFPYKDIYSGVYTGYLQSSTTHQGSFNEDYPQSYGFKDSTGNEFKINRRKGFTEFTHTSGSSIRFDTNGNISLLAKNKIVMSDIGGNVIKEFDIGNGGDTDDNPTKDITHDTETKTVNSVTEVITTKDTTIRGSESVKILSGRTVNVGGSESKTVSGTSSKIILSSDRKLVAADSEQTFGTGKKETIVAGDYSCSLLLGDYTIDLTSGTITLKNTAGGELKINSAGKVALGNSVSAIELLAQISAQLSALSSQMTSASKHSHPAFGSSPSDAANWTATAASLNTIKSNIDSIKGTL